MRKRCIDAGQRKIQMDRNKKFIDGEGGYVFISHSHQDIEKVRKIRNEMEDQGFEPLCFYLKCLTDDYSCAC